MSPWLSHVLMHQKGLKKAWLVACAVITHWNPVLQSFPGCQGGQPGWNLLSLMCDLASGSLFCP